jgi:hypothetical protein
MTILFKIRIMLDLNPILFASLLQAKIARVHNKDLHEHDDPTALAINRR